MVGSCNSPDWNSGEAEIEDSPTPQGLRRGRIPDVPYLSAVEA
jgi:hypothetical protein